MKKHFAVLLFLFCTCMLCAGDFVLIRDGKPQCVIQPEPKCPREVYVAVSRFNQMLKTITGSTLPVHGRKTTLNRITFRLKPAKKQTELDHFTITFPDPKTMEIQATKISVQWAFNHLLRKYANAEWVMIESCGLSYTPMKTLVIPAEKIVVKNVSWPIQRTNTHKPDWWKLNMRSEFRIGHDLTYHAFPSYKYAKNNSWPKVIMPVINGKKITKLPDPKRPELYWQPCYSNPETAKIAVANLLEYLKKRPGTLYVSLGCNDNAGYCECASCMKMDRSATDRSQSYFTFINRVLNEVCKVYPDLIVSVFAYDRTYLPPTFKLHKNAMVVLCIDFHSCILPEMYAKHKRAITEWGQKAGMLGVWDYSWGFPYPAPRLYAPHDLNMLKMLHENKARGYFGESLLSNAYEGPKQYLIARYLWDSSLDMKKVEEEWYIRCVGKKAAPYLKAYFKVWNDYYANEVKGTPWARSLRNVYANYGDHSCIYGIREKEYTASRKAMEKVVALAETAQEKERAAVFMRHWRHTELRLRMLGAGIYHSNGSITTVKQARLLLDRVRQYPSDQKKYDAISAVFCKDPDAKVTYLNKYYLRTGGSPVGRNFIQTTGNHILAASAFAGDPVVSKQMLAIAKDPAQPALIRQLCKALGNPASQKNLIPAGDGESVIPADFEIHPQLRNCGRLSISSEQKSSGKKSFLVSITGSNTLLWAHVKAKPNRMYLATFRVFIAKPSAEGYLQTNLYAMKNRVNQQYRMAPPLKLSGGVWQTFPVLTSTRENSNGLCLRIRMLKFEKGDKIFFDEVRIMDIGPAPAKKTK